MGSVDGSNWPLLSDIVYLDCVVPTSRCNNVLTSWIKFNAKYSIGMSRHFPVFLHFEDNRFSLLIIKPNVLIFSSSSQESTFTVVVYGVKLIIRVIFALPLVKAFS